MKLLLTRNERLRYLGFDDLWAILLGVPLLALMATVLFTATEKALTPVTVVVCFLIGLAHTIAYWYWGRMMVVELRRRLPRQEQTVRRVVAMIGGAILLVVAIETSSRLLLLLLVPLTGDSGHGDSPLAFQFAISFTLIILVLGAYEATYFFTKYRHSLVEQERLSRVNMQAQLSVLRQQVNPHFLFNSLNTLTSLIPEDADKAAVFTQRLSAVYRRILEYRHQELIPLEEELGAVRDYIYLMQMRFEDKLVVTLNFGAGPQVQGKLVPLSLQLLVENALKHNVVSHDSPLRIDITVEPTEVVVTNSLHLRSRKALYSTGWGQESIFRRYRMVSERPVVVEQTDTNYRVRLPLLPVAKEVQYASA